MDVVENWMLIYLHKEQNERTMESMTGDPYEQTRAHNPE